MEQLVTSSYKYYWDSLPFPVYKIIDQCKNNNAFSPLVVKESDIDNDDNDHCCMTIVTSLCVDHKMFNVACYLFL